MRDGVLPIQTIEALITSGHLKGVREEHLNPDSFNLPVSGRVYRVDSVFSLRKGEPVESVLDRVNAQVLDFSKPLRLERKVPYLFEHAVKIALPSMVHAYGNPRSSIGRANVFCRQIADGVEGYDYLPKGWSGRSWSLVRADSFPVLVHPGTAFTQLRLFEGRGFLDELELEIAIKQCGLLFDARGRRIPPAALRRDHGSVICSLYVGDHMGYECRTTNQVLDLSKTGHAISDFFEPIHARKDKSYILREGSFYILSTDEFVLVPAHLAGDLRAVDPRIAEVRTHKAGYINPGWGCGVDGKGRGDPITLEVIPGEDMLVRKGQALASLRYDRMLEVPRVVYAGAKSSYVGQPRAALAKFFD